MEKPTSGHRDTLKCEYHDKNLLTSSWLGENSLMVVNFTSIRCTKVILGYEKHILLTPVLVLSHFSREGQLNPVT